MEKYLASYDQCVALKELGFRERVNYYFEDGVLKIHPTVTGWDFNTSFITCVSRPTYSQAFRWFREKYNIQSSVKFTHAKYSFEIYFEKLANGENPPVMVWHLIDSWLGLNLDLFETYEEAESACIDKLIELVKKK